MGAPSRTRLNLIRAQLDLIFRRSEGPLRELFSNSSDFQVIFILSQLTSDHNFE